MFMYGITTKHIFKKINSESYTKPYTKFSDLTFGHEVYCVMEIDTGKTSNQVYYSNKQGLTEFSFYKQIEDFIISEDDFFEIVRYIKSGMNIYNIINIVYGYDKIMDMINIIYRLSWLYGIDFINMINYLNNNNFIIKEEELFGFDKRYFDICHIDKILHQIRLQYVKMESIKDHKVQLYIENFRLKKLCHEMGNIL